MSDQNVQSGNCQQASQSSTFLAYKIGDEPNIPMLLLGSCCCFIGMFAQLHNIREELKKLINSKDDLHWVYVIFFGCGVIDTDAQLTLLEKQYGITARKSFPALLAVFVPFVNFLALRDFMNRLNDLAQKINAEQNN